MSGRSRIVDEMIVLANLNSLDRVAVIEQLRDSWRKKVISQFNGQPEKIEEIFSNGDLAFQQLSKVLRALSLPEKSAEEAVASMALEQADRSFREKNYSEAYRLYAEVMERGQVLSADSLAIAGTAAFYIERLDAAESLAGKALALESENIKATVLKGLVAYSQKKFDRAKMFFEKAIRLKPDSPTILRYKQAAEEKASKSDSQISQAGAHAAKSFKRRWARRACNLEMMVNDFDQMTALNAKVRSLSAGGCLIDDLPVPEVFAFCLDLGNGKAIQGTAKKIYTTKNRQIGIQFEGIQPRDQDLIQRKLMV